VEEALKLQYWMSYASIFYYNFMQHILHLTNMCVIITFKANPQVNPNMSCHMLRILDSDITNTNYSFSSSALALSESATEPSLVFKAPTPLEQAILPLTDE